MSTGSRLLAPPECSTVGVQQEVPPCIRSTIRPIKLVVKTVRPFGEEDYLYRCRDNTCLCPAGQTLFYQYTSVENGMTLHQ